MNILLRETDRLMNMAEQIRFIEDIESHELNLNRATIKLSPWLEEIVGYFRPEIEKKQGKKNRTGVSR